MYAVKYLICTWYMVHGTSIIDNKQLFCFRMQGAKGVPIIPQVFEKVKFKGHGHEVSAPIMLKWVGGVVWRLVVEHIV